MYNEENEYEETGASDTPLTKDLYEHLERRKEQRLQIIETTEKVQSFLISWSLNATGYFIARALLLFGGSTNLWVAITLCFAISSTSSFAKLSNGFNANYNNGLEVTGAEKLIGAVSSLGMSGAVTFLSVKDFMHHQAISDTTIVQIKQDVKDLEAPSLWGSPWALGGGIFILFVVLAKLFIGGKKNG